MAFNRNNQLLQGKQPEQLVKTQLSLVTSAATAFGTVSIPHPSTVDYTDIRFELKTLGAETMLLTGSLDGTNYESSLKPYKNADGLIPSSANLVDGVYVIPTTWPYQKYKFVKSSATATAVAAFSATYVPKN